MKNISPVTLAVALLLLPAVIYTAMNPSTDTVVGAVMLAIAMAAIYRAHWVLALGGTLLGMMGALAILMHNVVVGAAAFLAVLIAIIYRAVLASVDRVHERTNFRHTTVDGSVPTRGSASKFRKVKARSIGNGRALGIAGEHAGNAASVKQFGKMNAENARKGEEAVGAMLEDLAAQYGGFVMHTGHFNPFNATGADVDHIFVTPMKDGVTRVIILDAKFWRYGKWGWNGTDQVRGQCINFQTKQPETVTHKMGMADAVAYWSTFVGPKARVSSIVTFAQPLTEKYDLSNVGAPGTVRLGTIESARAAIESLLQGTDGQMNEAVVAKVSSAKKND